MILYQLLKRTGVVVTLYVFRSHAPMNQAYAWVGDFIHVGIKLENDWLPYMTWLLNCSLTGFVRTGSDYDQVYDIELN